MDRIDHDRQARRFARAARGMERDGMPHVAERFRLMAAQSRLAAAEAAASDLTTVDAGTTTLGMGRDGR